MSRFSADEINRKLGDLNWVSRAAIAHETIVESFRSARAVVPMKFLTIFSSDERAHAEIAANERRVSEAITRVAGRDEWGVRVTLDRARAAASDAKTAPAPRATGSDYLRRKKAARDHDVELSARARRVVGELYDRLAPRASEARRRTGGDLPMADGPLLLDAAFLVPRARTKSFNALVAREARALAPQGYQVVVTGPWPPYTFVKD